MSRIGGLIFRNYHGLMEAPKQTVENAQQLQIGVDGEGTWAPTQQEGPGAPEDAPSQENSPPTTDSTSDSDDENLDIKSLMMSSDSEEEASV
jgi:hypothetical protein